MVGAVIFTHGEMGHGIMDALQSITGEQDDIIVLSIEGGSCTDDTSKMLEDAISKVNDGSGVIIFTDMLGGTPSNLSLPYLNKEKIDIFMGVNLPLLVKFVSKRESLDFSDLVGVLKDTAKDSIVIASEILSKEESKG